MPFYSASASNVATALNSQFFAIRAGASALLRIHEIRLFTRAATLTPIAVSRTSPISTGGGAVTLQKLDVDTRASTATVATVATAGTVTAGDLWSWGAAAAGSGFIWIPPAPLFVTGGGEVVLRALAAGSAVDVGCVVED